MAYKLVNFEKDKYDDEIETGLNEWEASGYRVVLWNWHESGHLKVLVHLEEGR
jgi:hypothetical protein